MKWKLKCLICAELGELNLLPKERADVHICLVSIQNHVMKVHGYGLNDLFAQTRSSLGNNHYIYTMPDGKDWLEAELK